MKKFFVKPDNVSNNQILIDGDEFFHLSKVLRCNVGDKIICLCGDEFQYYCHIQNLEKNSAVAIIENKVFCSANPKFEINLFQALPKGEKLELIIQKISELGATKLTPFTSQHTIAKNNVIKMERLKKIAKETCKQCGRSKPLEILETINICTIEKYIKDYDLVIFAYENANFINKITNIENEIKNSKKIAIIVGAEGGFSDKEFEYISSLNTKSVSLGKRILRTETTAITLVAFVSFLLNN